MNVLENFEPVVKRLLYQGQETSQELINQLFEKNASVVAVVGCIAAVATGTLSLHLAKKVNLLEISNQNSPRTFDCKKVPRQSTLSLNFFAALYVNSDKAYRR